MKSPANTNFERALPKTASGHTEPNSDVPREPSGAERPTYLTQVVLPREYARCQRYLHPISIVLCDVDRLRLINDGFGHDAGNEVLREFCARARRVLRVFDWLVGSGEDEFTIILPETGLTGAATVAERLRKIMQERPVSAPTGEFHFTISVGYCAIESSAELAQFSPDSLLQTAHEQLRLAVQNGRNRVCGAGVGSSQSAGCSTAELKTLTTVPAPDLLTLLEYEGAAEEPDVWPRTRR
jgi:diguanylate cyclase (GGDEF)-like protein